MTNLLLVVHSFSKTKARTVSGRPRASPQTRTAWTCRRVRRGRPHSEGPLPPRRSSFGCRVDKSSRSTPGPLALEKDLHWGPSLHRDPPGTCSMSPPTRWISRSLWELWTKLGQILFPMVLLLLRVLSPHPLQKLYVNVGTGNSSAQGAHFLSLNFNLKKYRILVASDTAVLAKHGSALNTTL